MVKHIEQGPNLQDVINCVNYEVKNSCSFSLKYSPMEKAFVNDTGCNWFSLLESHIIFDASLEHIMIILKVPLFSLSMLSTKNTHPGILFILREKISSTSCLSEFILDLLSSVVLCGRGASFTGEDSWWQPKFHFVSNQDGSKLKMIVRLHCLT